MWAPLADENSWSIHRVFTFKITLFHSTSFEALTPLSISRRALFLFKLTSRPFLWPFYPLPLTSSFASKSSAGLFPFISFRFHLVFPFASGPWVSTSPLAWAPFPPPAVTFAGPSPFLWEAYLPTFWLAFATPPRALFAPAFTSLCPFLHSLCVLSLPPLAEPA